MNKEKLIEAWDDLGYEHCSEPDDNNEIVFEYVDFEIGTCYRYTKTIIIKNNSFDVIINNCGNLEKSTTTTKELKLITKTMEFLKGSGE